MPSQFASESQASSLRRAKPVRFGEPIQLGSGDILGLANTAVLRFYAIEDFDETAVDGTVKIESSPEDAWALLIDGSHRTGVPIRGQSAYLTFDCDLRISAVDSRIAATFAAVHLRPVEGYPCASLEAIAGDIQNCLWSIVWTRNASTKKQCQQARHSGLTFASGTGSKKLNPNRAELKEPSRAGIEAAKRAVFRMGERWFEIIRSRASFKHVSATDDLRH